MTPQTILNMLKHELVGTINACTPSQWQYMSAVIDMLALIVCYETQAQPAKHTEVPNVKLTRAELPPELIAYLKMVIDDIKDADVTRHAKVYNIGWTSCATDILSGVWRNHEQSQPAKRDTTVRTCSCGKPLHAIDAGDDCPACLHKRDKTKAPF